MGCVLGVPPKLKDFIGEWHAEDGNEVYFGPKGKFVLKDVSGTYNGWIVEWNDLGRGGWEFFSIRTCCCCGKEKSRTFVVQNGPSPLSSKQNNILRASNCMTLENVEYFSDE